MKIVHTKDKEAVQSFYFNQASHITKKEQNSNRSRIMLPVCSMKTEKSSNQEAMITSHDKKEKSSIMVCKKQDLYFPTNK
jgi:hypothetical protein